MNNVVLMGRLTREPRVTHGNATVARYTLAVNRRMKKEGAPDADFIPCVAFNKAAEFAEKYLAQGTKVLVTGRIETGSYTNKEGQKVYTTEVIVQDQEFAESKRQTQAPPFPLMGDDGFMEYPLDEDLPFE